MKPLYPSLEILEQRIAPAATYTYINPAGGSVKITTSKGTDADLAGTLTFIPTTIGQALHTIDLTSHPIFRGTDLLFEVTGAGTADVVLIDAHGFDLGQVTVPGDVGKILAGDANLSTPGAKSLHIGSLGLALAVPGPATEYQSVIRGPLLSLELDHDLAGSLSVQGNALSRITSAHLHGSLLGTSGEETGTLHVQGGIDTLVVDGDLGGGDGLHTGSITAGGLIRSATISGSIAGGKGVGSGVLSTTGDILSLHITGTVLGQVSSDALGQNGQVRARKIMDATVAGPVVGGYFDFSGSIAASISIGTISVLSGLAGGHGTESGAISAGSTIAHAVFGESAGVSGGMGIQILGGAGRLSGSVHSATLGFIEVHGDVQGGAGEVSGGISSVRSTARVLIHGKLTGGAMDNSGSIGSGGTIGEVEVQQGIFGGDGLLSGSVAAFGKITTVIVGVELKGGGGESSGTVGTFGNLGTVHIAGSITGSMGDLAGGIFCGLKVTSLIVDGSVVGGDGSFGGRIEARSIPFVKIGGDLQGGGGIVSGSIEADVSMGTVDIAGSIVGSTKAVLGGGDASLTSFGPVFSIHIGGDIKGGLNSESGSIYAGGTIASVVVDGSLLGGGDFYAGSISTSETGVPGSLHPSITKASIGGYIQGGGGEASGVVESAGSIGTLSVLGVGSVPAGLAVGLGDVAGGAGRFSGSIHSFGSMGTIAVAGSLVGDGDWSGQIFSEGSIAKLTVGGSVKANGYYVSNIDPLFTGQILALKTLTSLEVTGNVFGGDGEGSGTIAAGTIGSVLIHGSLYGGDGTTSGSVTAFRGDLGLLKVDGAIETKGLGAEQYIRAERNIGTVAAGSIAGGNAPVIIVAAGQSHPKTAAAALAIKSVSTAGSMVNTQILAGHGFDDAGILVLRNAESSIGTVEVGTSGSQANIYMGNDIAAGFHLSGTKKGLKSALLSSIAEVIIHGSIGQSSVPHQILADFVKSVIVDDVPASLKAGPRNDYRVPIGANPAGIASVLASEREGV